MESREWLDKYNPFNSVKAFKHIDYWTPIVKDGKIPPPFFVSIDLCGVCNYDCPFCVDSEEPILMEDFTYKKIKDIKPGEYVVGYDKKRGGLLKSKVIDVFNNGRSEEMIQVSLDDGDSLLCTEYHKIWHARSRWKQAINFRVGDRIKKISKFSDRKGISDDFKRGYISGMANGDGCYWLSKNRSGSSSGRFRLALKDKEPMNRFMEFCSDLDISAHWGNHTFKTSFKSNRDKYKYKGRYDAVWVTDDINARKVKKLMEFDTETKEFVLGWVSGIFDAEGSLSAHNLRIAQTNINKPIKDRIYRYLSILNFSPVEELKGIRAKIDHYDKINFFVSCRPCNKNKREGLFNNKRFRKIKVDKITKVKGEFIKYDLKTETSNYFVRGVLVHNCNAKVIRDKVKAIMTVETMDKVIKVLKAWKVRCICLGGGGESTLNKNIGYMITKLHENGIEVGLVSNGYNIDHIAGYAHLCKWIGFSIDAGTPETYSKMKGTKKEDFYRVIGNLKALSALKKDNSPEVSYKYLILPNNTEEVYDAAKIAKEVGCDLIHFRPGSYGWFEAENSDNYTFQKKNIESVVESLNKAREDFEHGGFKIYGITHKFSVDFRPKKSFYKCYASLVTCFISPNGDVGLCCDRRGDSKIVLGTVDNILEKWGSKEHQDIHNSIYPSTCPRCTLTHVNELFENVIIDDKMMCDFI